MKHLIFILLLLATPASAAEHPWLSITAKELQTHVYKLGQIPGGRAYGSLGNQLAAEYIENEFKQSGMRTHRQAFSTGGKRCENILTWTDLPRDASNRNEVIVVGAHRDSIGNAGADDNASGTATVMEVAEAVGMMPKKLFKRTVVFILFDAEEIGMHGSYFYVQHPLFPLGQPSMQNHVAMINLDMVGRYGYTCRTESRGLDLRSLVHGLKERWPWCMELATFNEGPSDHTPFISRGVPAVFVHTGTRNSRFHTQQDVPSTLNYKAMEGIAKFTFELVLKAAGAM